MPKPVVIGKPKYKSYTYIYSALGQPFYVGVGTTGSDRHLDHFFGVASGQLMQRKVKKLIREGHAVTIKIDRSFTERDAACKREKELIAKYGRVNSGGILCNITEGGDGGDTYVGRKLYHHPSTLRVKASLIGKQPKGWKPGRPVDREYPTIACYCPKTLKRSKLWSKDDLPKGWLLGAPSGTKTGPKGQRCFYNPSTYERTWVKPNEEPPSGWVAGSPVKSTLNKTGYYDPVSQKRYWIAEGINPLKGWIKGAPPHSNPCNKRIRVGRKTYPSIQAACTALNITRYKLLKQPHTILEI